MAGAWNQGIFKPEWAQSVLFGGVMPIMEVLFTVHGITMQFSAIGMKVAVVPSQANVVLASSFDDETVQCLETIALRLLNRLPETPVNGVGINFGFDVREQCQPLDDLFNLSDKEKMSEIGAAVISANITRTVTLEGKVINVIITRREDGITKIDFNHHYTVSTAAEASQKLQNSVRAAKSISLEMSRHIYGLTLEAT
jgi:hypothetical protein